MEGDTSVPIEYFVNLHLLNGLLDHILLKALNVDLFIHFLDLFLLDWGGSWRPAVFR